MRISDWSSDVCSSDLFFLIEKFGWRHALLWLAGINLLCTLIHIVTVRRPLSESTEPEIAITTPSTTLRTTALARIVRDPIFWLVTGAFAANAALTTILAVYLVPLFIAQGFSVGEVIAAAALMGPEQIDHRLLLVFVGQHE